MAGGAEPVLREPVADLAQLVLGRTRRRRPRPRRRSVATETGVLVGLVAAQAVIHMQRRDIVAERRRTCQRQVESGPPETRTVTSPPGGMRVSSRMNASTRSGTVCSGIGDVDVHLHHSKRRSVSSEGPGIQPGRRGESRGGGPGSASGVLRRRRAPVLPSGAARRRRRASPGWRDAPALQERDGLFELVGSEPVRACACSTSGTRRAGSDPVARGERVRDRQRVSDDERALLGPREHEPEAAHVSLDDAPPALATAGNLVAGRRRVRPRAVFLEVAALEPTVERVVQLGDDEPRNVASREREVGGLPRTFELTRDAQVDRIVGDCAPSARASSSPLA